MNFLYRLIVLALFTTTVQSTFPSTAHIKHIINSLEKVIEFYDASIEQSNLDGVYGLRIVEGVIQHIKDIFLYQLLDDTIKFKVKALLDACKEPIRKGIRAVERNDPKQFKLLKSLITEPYVINYIPRNIKPELRWPFVLNIQDSYNVINEGLSDKCFAALFADRKSSKCEISKECSKLVTTPNLRSYPLTHQILFSVEASKTDTCFRSWSDMLGLRGYLSNTEFQRIWCTNSYYELLGYVQAGRTRDGKRYHNVEPRNLDLVFEILFVCPSIGFHEFLKEEYITVITNAQHSTGCFKDPTKSSYQRQLLEEKETEDGCMFHLTAVAAGALSVYLQYVLTLMYTSDRFHLHLLNDNKHYLEAVEQGRLALLPRKHDEVKSINLTFYIIFIAVNLVFIVLLIRRGKLSPLRRLLKRLLPV